MSHPDVPEQYKAMVDENVRTITHAADELAAVAGELGCKIVTVYGSRTIVDITFNEEGGE